MVAECDFRYTLYRVGVVASNGSRYRHLLIVPTNVSVASFDVGLTLVEADSIKADTGLQRWLSLSAQARDLDEWIAVD